MESVTHWRESVSHHCDCGGVSNSCILPSVERSVSIGAIVGGCLAAVAVVLLVVMAVVLCACCVGSRKQKRVRLPSYSLSLVPR